MVWNVWKAMETYEKQSKPKAYRKTPPPTDRCQAMRNNEKLRKQIESVRDTWHGMKKYENLWKSMGGSSWQSMDINGNCHNSLEVHGCPRKRVDISFHKCGAERWGQTNVVVFNEPDTKTSQPAPRHRPRAYRGRPRCAWSWLKSTEKHWKAKTTHEMNHETYETVIQESYEKLWKLMKNVQTPWKIRRIPMNTLKIEQNKKHRKYTDNWQELWNTMKSYEKPRRT